MGRSPRTLPESRIDGTNRMSRSGPPNITLAERLQGMSIIRSDHGEMLGDHRWLRKRTPYKPSARVPVLLNFPDEMEVRQERVIDRPVN